MPIRSFFQLWLWAPGATLHRIFLIFNCHYDRCVDLASRASSSPHWSFRLLQLQRPTVGFATWRDWKEGASDSSGGLRDSPETRRPQPTPNSDHSWMQVDWEPQRVSPPALMLIWTVHVGKLFTLTILYFSPWPKEKNNIGSNHFTGSCKDHSPLPAQFPDMKWLQHLWRMVVAVWLVMADLCFEYIHYLLASPHD